MRLFYIAVWSELDAIVTEGVYHACLAVCILITVMFRSKTSSDHFALRLGLLENMNVIKDGESQEEEYHSSLPF